MGQITSRSINIGSAKNQSRCEVQSDAKLSRAHILEVWVETGRWWQGEERRTCYRLLTEDGKVLEIYKEPSAGEWCVLRWID